MLTLLGAGQPQNGSYVNELINQFKARVASEGGVFQAEACLKATLTELNSTSLLEQASLVITPNAVEEGKLFSIIPSDGSGDMSAVRATTATLVNSGGVIEGCPYNLSKNSEQIGVGTWTGQNFSMSTELIGFFPFDTSVTCIKGINSTTGFNQIYNTSVPTIIGTNYTLTGFLKSDDTPYYFFDLASAGSGIRVVYDNINKIIINSPVGVVCEIIDIGSGWISFRITYTATIVNNLGSLKVYCSTNSSSFNTGIPIGTTIYATKVQVVTGTEPKEYFPTTDRLNVPRLDYTNGSCPSILVEPQRTNLLTYSEQFENVSWGKQNVTVAANQTTAPDGNLTSDLLSGVSVSATYLFQNATVVSGQQYTISIFAKKNQTNFLQIFGSGGFGAFTWANFDLENGIIGNKDASTNATITNYGNGWYRCTITNTTVSTVGGCFFNPINSASATRNPLFNATDHSIYIWGAQLEAGSNATSYIPTIASAVTRNADVISKSGISDLIGQTEGTIYAEIKVDKLLGTTSRYIFHLSDGTASNRIYMAFSGSSSNILRGRIFNGGVLQCSIDSSTITTTGTYKLALSYKNNDIVFYINGVQIGTDTSATIPTCNRVNLGCNYAGASQFNDGINNATIWKTRLSNTELTELTTL